MPVIGRVMLAGLFGVVRGVVQMAFRDMRMVARLFVIAGRMVLGCGLVMFSRLFVVLRCFVMVLDCVFGHGKLSSRKIVLLIWVPGNPGPAYSRIVTAPWPSGEFHAWRRGPEPKSQF